MPACACKHTSFRLISRETSLIDRKRKRARPYCHESTKQRKKEKKFRFFFLISIAVVAPTTTISGSVSRDRYLLCAHRSSSRGVPRERVNIPRGKLGSCPGREWNLPSFIFVRTRRPDPDRVSATRIPHASLPLRWTPSAERRCRNSASMKTRLERGLSVSVCLQASTLYHRSIHSRNFRGYKRGIFIGMKTRGNEKTFLRESIWTLDARCLVLRKIFCDFSSRKTRLLQLFLVKLETGLKMYIEIVEHLF